MVTTDTGASEVGSTRLGASLDVGGREMSWATRRFLGWAGGGDDNAQLPERGNPTAEDGLEDGGELLLAISSLCGHRGEEEVGQRDS